MLSCSPLSLLFARALLLLILVPCLPLQPAVCEDLQVQHAELQKALQVGSHWFVCRQTSWRLQFAVPLVFIAKGFLVKVHS